MADQLFCEKRLDWDAPVTEVQTLDSVQASSEKVIRDAGFAVAGVC